jgi:hypothetical protein
VAEPKAQRKLATVKSCQISGLTQEFSQSLDWETRIRRITRPYFSPIFTPASANHAWRLVGQGQSPHQHSNSAIAVQYRNSSVAVTYLASHDSPTAAATGEKMMGARVHPSQQLVRCYSSSDHGCYMHGRHYRFDAKAISEAAGLTRMLGTSAAALPLLLLRLEPHVSWGEV